MSRLFWASLVLWLTSCALTIETHHHTEHRTLVESSTTVDTHGPDPVPSPAPKKDVRCPRLQPPPEREIPQPLGLLNPLVTTPADTERVMVAYIRELQDFIREERGRWVAAYERHRRQCQP